MPEVVRAWRVWFAWCLAVLMVTGIALLLTRTEEMAGNSQAGLFASLEVVLAKTHFGHVWALHLLAVLFLWPVCAVTVTRPTSPSCLMLAVAGMVVLAFTYSAVSHAGDRGDFTVAELNDWLHVVSTSVWGGGIFVTQLVAFPLLRKRHAVVSLVAARLSSLSAIALALVLFSGISNALLRLHSLRELLDTDYGHVLSVKVALVGVMVLLGAINRFVIIPRIRRYSIDDDAESAIWYLRLTLAMDTVLLVFVLTAAGLLIQGMPPSMMQGMRNMAM